MKNCLILGRKATIVDEIQKSADAIGVNLLAGTSLQDVKDAFGETAIDVVIMGAGLDIEVRLEIVRYVFETSNSTAVHMKDRDSGPAGMLTFVQGVLSRL